MPNSQTLKITSSWSRLGLFFMLMGGGLILATLAQGILPQDNLKLTQVITTVLFFFIPAYTFARVSYEGSPFVNLGFRPAQRPLFYLLGLLLMLFAFPLQGWLGDLNRHVPFPDWVFKMEQEVDKRIEQYLSGNSSFGLLINVLVMALLPAVIEEAFFRGGLQRVLIQCLKSPWAGIITTGILFSAIHMQFLGFFPRAFMGILLGALYYYSGSLWVSILGHFLINGGQILAVALYPRLISEDISFPWYVVLISLPIVVGLLVWLILYSKKYPPTQADPKSY